MIQEYRDDYFHIRIEDGIVFVEWLSSRIEDISIIENAIRKRLEIQDGKSYPMFGDIRKVKGGNPKVRKRLAEADNFEGITALSVLCSTRFQIMQINFFHLKHKPPIPCRVFNDKNTALTWLSNSQTQDNSLEKESISFANDSFELTFEDNFLYVNWLKEKYNENDIDFIIKKRLELANGRFYLVLTDLSNVKSGSRAALRRMAEGDAFWGIIASAALCKSKVQQMMYKMFHAIWKSRIPHKSFTKKEDALTWLKGFC